MDKDTVLTICINELERGKLLSLPAKYEFAMRHGMGSVDEVHDWMRSAREEFVIMVNAMIAAGSSQVETDPIPRAWTTPDGLEPISAELKAARPDLYDKHYTVPLGVIRPQQSDEFYAHTSGNEQALLEMVHAMFRSSNDIPVTRITVDRRQYESALNAELPKPSHSSASSFTISTSMPLTLG